MANTDHGIEEANYTLAEKFNIAAKKYYDAQQALASVREQEGRAKLALEEAERGLIVLGNKLAPATSVSLHCGAIVLAKDECGGIMVFKNTVMECACDDPT